MVKISGRQIQDFNANNRSIKSIKEDGSTFLYSWSQEGLLSMALTKAEIIKEKVYTDF